MLQQRRRSMYIHIGKVEMVIFWVTGGIATSVKQDISDFFVEANYVHEHRLQYVPCNVLPGSVYEAVVCESVEHWARGSNLPCNGLFPIGMYIDSMNNKGFRPDF